MALPDTDDSGAPAVVSSPNSLLHEASFKTETREVPARPIATLPQAAAISSEKPATAAKPAVNKSAEKPGLAAAHRHALVLAMAGAHAKPQKSVDKPKVVTAKALTKPVRLAKVDPLAPLPAKHSGHSKDAAAD